MFCHKGEVMVMLPELSGLHLGSCRFLTTIKIGMWFLKAFSVAEHFEAIASLLKDILLFCFSFEHCFLQLCVQRQLKLQFCVR